MPLVNDAGLDPTNATYDMAVDGYVIHASATVTVSKKYIAKDGNYPNGSGGFLAVGSLALCTATAPETWVALNAPFGMRLADSATGIVWLRSHSTNPNFVGWDPIEAWLDIVADYNSTDVSGPLNTLFTTVAAISNSIPVHLGPTQNAATFPYEPLGWQILNPVINKAANPVICRAPIYWMATTTGNVAVTVGDPTQPSEVISLARNEYWVEYGKTFAPNYTTQTTGLQIVNLSNGRFAVRSRFFWMGVEVKGTGGANNGCTFNDIDVVSTYGCLKCVGWTGATGFINENTFRVSECTHQGSSPTDSACSLRINLADNNSEANGNKWYSGPSFEGSTVVGGDNFIELVGGRTATGVGANEFHGIRFDGPVVPNFINCGGSYAMVGNLFNVAFYQAPTVPPFGGTNLAAVTACALNTFELPLSDPRAGRYDAHPIVKFGRRNMTQRLDTDGLHIQSPARSKLYLRQNPAFFGLSPWQDETRAAYGQLTADAIQLLSGSLALLGTFLDVRNTPRGFLNKALFRVNLGANAASACRMGFIAWEPDGQTIISSANDVQVLFGGNLANLPFSSPFWSFGGDSTQANSSFEIAWSSNVGFIYLFAGGGTNTTNIADMAAYAPADSGVLPLYNSQDIPFVVGATPPVGLGPTAQLIDDDLPYSVAIPCDPQGPAVSAITQANPGVVTTATAHGFTTGQVVYLNGVSGMTQVNAQPFTITVLTTTTFSLGVDTTSYGAYVSGGVASLDFIPRGQTVRAWRPTGASGSAREWVRTTADTWAAINF